MMDYAVGSLASDVVVVVWILSFAMWMVRNKLGRFWCWRCFDNDDS
jgi:hypothetical protein